jgi:hypothetical protein
MPVKKKSSSPKIHLVRCRNSGVNVGVIVRRDGSEITLEGSHKIWRWRGANTLHELAANGASMTDYTRISEPAPGEVVLLDAVEIIECSPKAADNLRRPRWLS